MTVEHGQPSPINIYCALRLVPGDQCMWLVDQAVHLLAEDTGAESTDAELRVIAEHTDTEALRAALERTGLS